MCCSVLQCVAVCCSVLQCAAVWCSVLQCVAVCCRVLQCVAVECGTLCSIVVCCSVLQCVAVSCSVLQCLTYPDVYQDVIESCGADGVWQREMFVTPLPVSFHSSVHVQKKPIYTLTKALHTHSKEPRSWCLRALTSNLRYKCQKIPT